MNAKQALLSVLDAMGLPYWIMHEMPHEIDYPPKFCTYMTTDAPFVDFHDNAPRAVAWAFMIGFYSNAPGNIDSDVVRLVIELRKAGFVVHGLGEDVQSDEPTHIGRRLTLAKLEQFEMEE